MQNIKLHHYYRSSCSWRVRWVLKIKEVSYEEVAVNLLEKEQNSRNYTNKNPSAFVPCLELENGETYGESLAMMEWLEERYPNPPLLPQDPFSKMRVRQLAYIISSGTQPLQNLSAQKYFSTDKSKQLEYARFWIDKGLNNFEAIAAKTSGTFSFGESLTFADICLVPQCYNAERFGVNLSNYPSVVKVYKKCRELSSCILSSPEKYK